MMQPVVVRLPDEERRLLKIEAQTLGVPVSEVARKAIKTYLKKKPRRKSGAEVLLEWAKRAEKYKSRYGDTNLSTNYKKYLYGQYSSKFGYLWKKKK